MRQIVWSLAGAGFLVAVASSASAGVITSASFNSNTYKSSLGAWDPDVTAAATASLTSDSMDGDGAARYDFPIASAHWTSVWAVLGWFGADNSQAVADPSQIMVSFDAKFVNPWNNTIDSPVDLSAFHSGSDVGWAQQNMQTGSKTFSLTSNWAHISAPLSDFGAFDLSTNRNYLSIRLNYTGYAPAGTTSFYMDNLKLETVPEPGALALAIVGPSLIALRRRRSA